MDKGSYAQMLRFAKVCLPKDAFLEPGDLVNEAFIRVGSEDVGQLKHEISKLAYAERGSRAGRVSFEKASYRDNSLKETTQVCVRCHQEKTLDGFKLNRKHKSSATYYDRTCRQCRDKTRWERTVNDPARHAEHKHKQRIRALKRAAKRNGLIADDWTLLLERIKGQIDDDDWSLLASALRLKDMLPDALETPKPTVQGRTWRHKEIETLYEFYHTLRPAELALKLKRTEADVRQMMKEMDLI